MNDEPTQNGDSLLPLLVAFDEGLAAGREPALVAPPELTEAFESAQSVLRLLNQAWPRADATDATIDHPQRRIAPVGTVRGPLGDSQRLGRFEILRELGHGGFGVVYLAHDPMLNRQVALKAPRWDRWQTQEFRARSLHEAKAAAALDHHNIVRVLEADQTGPLVYIASAYC